MDIYGNNETAHLEMRGLGITTFCGKHTKFEEAFLRNEAHKFELTITGPITGKEGSEVGTIVDRKITELRDVEITITTKGQAESKGCERRENGEFSRMGDLNDPFDVRWIIDLGNELHGNPLVRNTSTLPGDKAPTTLLTVENAYFYAIMPSEEDRKEIPFFFRVEHQVYRPFGFLAEAYGARMKADAIVVSVRVGDNTEVYTLDHVDNSPYKIQIWNVDSREGAPRTEFKEIMKYLADPNGKDIDLSAWVPFVPGPPAFHGNEYCHPGACTAECINNFVP